ncbi:MAG: BON domain-containing protein [Methylococcales bacterium]|nr:BON domain-containing protein [Methylococcales bacterium]
MFKKQLLATLAISSGLMLAGLAQASPSAEFYLAENSAVENTELNARDQGNTTLTPEDQKETEGDLKITAAIRQAIIKNSHLSVNAQNVKIITRNGKVTLRGPVESKKESKKVKKIATHTPGVLKVDNQLEIKAP